MGKQLPWGSLSVASIPATSTVSNLIYFVRVRFFLYTLINFSSERLSGSKPTFDFDMGLGTEIVSRYFKFPI